MIAYIEIIARWVRDCLEPIMYIPVPVSLWTAPKTA